MDIGIGQIAIQEAVLGEKKPPLVRGKPPMVRRPERASKGGFQGRQKNLTGRDKGGEVEPREVPEKKKRITEFDDADDWMLAMILMGILHANPEADEVDAIEIAREWTRKLYMPKMNYLWRKQAIRIRRWGRRAEASRIRRELFKLL